MTITLLYILLSILIIISMYVMISRNLFSVIISTTIFSMICALIFLLLDAIDVSLTEAAVGAGISTILFLSTIRYVDIVAADTKKNTVPIVILFFLLLMSMSVLIYDLPELGKVDVANNSQATKYYIHHSKTEMGVPNVVTSVLAGYRGFDTLGEVIVIFIAGISVLGILRNNKRGI